MSIKYILRPALVGQVRDVARSSFGNPIALVSYMYVSCFHVSIPNSCVFYAGGTMIDASETEKDASAGYSAGNFVNKPYPVVLVMRRNRLGELVISYIETDINKAIAHFLKPRYNYHGKKDYDGTHRNDDARQADRVKHEFKILQERTYCLINFKETGAI